MINETTWIEQLKLTRHPEGGWYRETYRSDLIVPKSALSPLFKGDRNASTSIYFLLPSGERSLFHRIKSDELWHFHAGHGLSIYVIYQGELAVHKLGLDVLAGENPNVVIPAGAWFGAICESPNSYTLSGCTVAPGFDFEDFELASRSELLSIYPNYRKEIVLLTKDE